MAGGAGVVYCVGGSVYVGDKAGVGEVSGDRTVKCIVVRGIFDKLGFARSQRAMHSLAEWAAGSLLTGRRIRAKMYTANAATVSKLCLRTCRHGSVTCD